MLAAKVLVDEKKPRTCSRQINRGNPPAETISDYFKRVITIHLVDHLNSEIENRFDVSSVTAYYGLSIIPCNVISSIYRHKKFNWKEKISGLC